MWCRKWSAAVIGGASLQAVLGELVAIEGVGVSSVVAAGGVLRQRGRARMEHFVGVDVATLKSAVLRERTARSGRKPADPTVGHGR